MDKPTSEVVVSTVDGRGEHRGTALMLPGRAYPCSMSLLAWTTRALQSVGWTVHQAAWQPDHIPDEPRGFVEDAARALDAPDRRTGPVLVVAKSLGTFAAHWAAERGYAGAWLTPVLREAGARPLSDCASLLETIKNYPADSMVAGGTADELWVPGLRTTGRVLEIENADHSLEVEDWRASLHHHQRVAAAVADLATKLAGP